MSGKAIVSNGGWPVLVDTGELLGRTKRRRQSPPLRPRPVGEHERTTPRSGYVDAGRAALDLSCPVDEVAAIALAEGVSTEEVGGAIYFSEVGLELAVDRRRPFRPLSAPPLTPDDSRAGERLVDAAKRLGLTEDELTGLALGRVAMTTRDGDIYLRSRDLKRIERDQGLDKQAKARSAPSPLAPAPRDSATEERTTAAALALGLEDRMEPGESEESASGITRVKGDRERTRLGKPRRWSARP